MDKEFKSNKVFVNPTEPPKTCVRCGGKMVYARLSALGMIVHVDYECEECDWLFKVELNRMKFKPTSVN